MDFLGDGIADGADRPVAEDDVPGAGVCAAETAFVQDPGPVLLRAHVAAGARVPGDFIAPSGDVFVVADVQRLVISTAVDETSETAIIKVADAGPGVVTENVGNLFVKRFSTKREGTGLGLLTCKNIVDNHRGELSYHSGEDSKSIFEIKIPIDRCDDVAEEDSDIRRVPAQV